MKSPIPAAEFAEQVPILSGGQRCSASSCWRSPRGPYGAQAAQHAGLRSRCPAGACCLSRRWRCSR